MNIQIGKHQVGDGQPPFIVAEVGSNWRTFEDCKHSIAMAKQCGADAVKFQAFSGEALYGLPINSVAPALPLEWLPKLKEKADACAVEFMCSAFSPELIEAVDPYVNAHKVASSELTHVRMLEKLKQVGKPVILSTGASGLMDIKNALEVLGNTPVILLYCVSAYPAHTVRRSRMKHLMDKFPLQLVGFSDHTRDAGLVPQAMAEAGACLIEKHVNFVGCESPDAPHSLSMSEFQYMVSTLKGKEQFSLGSGEESAMVSRHNRRLLAITDIAVGETLQEGVNFGIYRSLKDDTHALTPWAIDSVTGKVALRAIKAGDGVGPGDV